MKEERQQIIEEFYRKLFSYYPNNLGMGLGGVVLTVFYGIYMWVPFRIHTNIGLDLVFFIFGILGPCLYMSMYYSYSEMGERHSILKKLSYLPVGKDEIRRFQKAKLLRFTMISGIVFAIGQVALSALITKHVGWQELAFAIGMGFVAPFAGNRLLLMG